MNYTSETAQDIEDATAPYETDYNAPYAAEAESAAEAEAEAEYLDSLDDHP